MIYSGGEVVIWTYNPTGERDVPCSHKGTFTHPTINLTLLAGKVRSVLAERKLKENLSE